MLGEVSHKWPISTLGTISELVLSMSEDENIAFDLQSQHKALTTVLLTVFPELVSMQFVHAIEWRRVEDSKAFRWKPFIPLSSRPIVHDMLTTTRQPVNDFDGCFAALFRSQ